MTTTTETPAKSKRGFASMSPEKQREIARKGGAATQPENRTFAKDKSLAATAGKKGGSSVDPANRSFSRDPELARAAGRKGGRIRHNGAVHP